MSKKFTETLIMQFDPRALCKRDELKKKQKKKKKTNKQKTNKRQQHSFEVSSK